LRLSRPEAVVLTAIGLSAGMCVVAAVTYGIQSAVLLAGGGGAANSPAKLALDAIIQPEVPEQLTAPAVARSAAGLPPAWGVGGGGWRGFRGGGGARGCPAGAGGVSGPPRGGGGQLSVSP